MENVEFKFEIEADDDGYVSYECPFCKSTFSLNASEVQSDDPVYTEMYCPYCGLNDNPSNFYTQEVIEQAQNIAMNYMIDEINKAFKKVTRKNNKYVKMTYKPLKNQTLKDLKTKEGTEEIFQCKNCCNHVKVDYYLGKTKVYCAFCGIDIC